MKIEQVLNNLIGNAIKFSPPGGTVAVRVSQAGASVAIEVTDQGPGVHADELEKLFQPFGKTSTQRTGGEKGAGLGLAIVQRIVNGHGGRIEVRTAQGKGATFRVLLPARTPSSKTEARDSVICKDRTS